MNKENEMIQAMITGWNRDDDGSYSKSFDDTLYTIERNADTGEWHLYVGGEWSSHVETLRHGKLVAVAKSIGAI